MTALAAISLSRSSSSSSDLVITVDKITSSLSSADSEKVTHKTRVLSQLIADNLPGYRHPSENQSGNLKELRELRERQWNFRGLGQTLDQALLISQTPTASSSHPISEEDEKDSIDFQEVTHFFNHKEWAHALPLLNVILDKDANCISALEMRLYIYYEEYKDMMNALADCHRILSINPAHETALTTRMKIHFDMEFYLGSKKDAQDLLKIDPDNIEATRYIGAICVQDNRPGDALLHLLDAWKDEADNTFTLLYLARAYHQLNDHKRALSFVNIVLKGSPLNTQALIVRARIFIKTHCLSQAIEDLSKIEIGEQNKEYTELLQQMTILKRKDSRCIKCIIC